MSTRANEQQKRTTEVPAGRKALSFWRLPGFKKILALQRATAIFVASDGLMRSGFHRV
jgi:hypothetical protein